MNYANIKKYDVANGVGVRVSLFVSGCTHRCKGCFNAEAWDFAYGRPYTEETQREVLDAVDKSYIAGLSLLGGEPFEPQNQRALLPLLRAFRARFPQKSVWCYTGYTLDTLPRLLQPAHHRSCAHARRRGGALVEGRRLLSCRTGRPPHIAGERGYLCKRSRSRSKS